MRHDTRDATEAEKRDAADAIESAIFPRGREATQRDSSPLVPDGASLLVVNEAAKLIGLPATTIYQFIREWRGPAWRNPKFPGSVRILSTDIEEWRSIAAATTKRTRKAPDGQYRGLITYADAERLYVASRAKLKQRIAEGKLTIYRDGRAYDVEHGPSETETEAFYQVVIGKPSQNSIARGLKAAAVERAHQTEGVGE